MRLYGARKRWLLPYDYGPYVLLASFTLEDVLADPRLRPALLRLLFLFVMTKLVTQDELNLQAKRGLLPLLEWEVRFRATLEVSEVGDGTLWYFQGVFINPGEALQLIGKQESSGRMPQQAAACFRELVEQGFEGYAFCDEDGCLRNSRVEPLGR